MPVVRNIFAGLFWRATAELSWTQLELSWKSCKAWYLFSVRFLFHQLKSHRVGKS